MRKKFRAELATVLTPNNWRTTNCAPPKPPNDALGTGRLRAGRKEFRAIHAFKQAQEELTAAQQR